MRLVNTFSSDAPFHSDCGMWIPNAPQAEIVALLKKHKLSVKTGVAKLKDCVQPEEVQASCCAINAIFPTTTYQDSNSKENSLNGYRIAIKIQNLDRPLGPDSLIYLKSVAHI